MLPSIPFRIGKRMMVSSNRRFHILALLLPIGASLVGMAGDGVLPKSYPVTRYSATWEHSPFLREITEALSLPSAPSFGERLTLEGIVSDDSRGVIAYLRDKETDESLMVTDRPSQSHPYLVVSASQVRDPGLTWVRISDGSQTAELGFASSGRSTGADRSSSLHSAPSPGAPALAVGHPNAGPPKDLDASEDKPKTTVAGPPRQRVRLPIPMPDPKKPSGEAKRPPTPSTATPASSPNTSRP